MHLDLGLLFSLIWPAYVANASPLVVSRVIKRRHPMDFGKYFIDGRRILGDGKTIEGFMVGVLAGSTIGYFTLLIYTEPSLCSAFVLSLGAMVGDSLGSFIKRRLGIPQGDSAIPLDQTMFIIIALLMHELVFPGTVPPQMVILAVAITVPIHLGTNFVAYLIGIKEVPF